MACTNVQLGTGSHYCFSDTPEAQAWDVLVMQRCCAHGYSLCRPEMHLGSLSVSALSLLTYCSDASSLSQEHS